MQPPAGRHSDPGLHQSGPPSHGAGQCLPLATVSAIFLHWLPHHSVPVLLLIAVAASAAAAIHLTHRRRYRASSHGISREAAAANVPAVLWTASASGC